MNRCWTFHRHRRFIATSICLGALAALLSPPAQAQMQRLFPHGVQRAQISFVEPPQVLLDGRPERLAPGARVRNEHNMIALSGTLRGQTFVVNYLRDPAGVVRDIWILTPQEAGGAPDDRPLERATPAYLN